MTTLATFVSELRLRLNDGTSTRWTDVELKSYLRESTERYGKLFPRLRETDFVTDGITNRYPIPDDLIDRKIHTIWEIYPNNTMVEVIAINQRSPWIQRYFEVIETEIIFGYVPPSGRTMRVRYSGQHTMPNTGDSTVPSEDQDLIFLWAEYLAWRKIGGSDASLSRWKETGNRADGPIIPHYVYLEKQYRTLVDEKKAGGRTLQLVRAPRRRSRFGGILY